MCLLLLSMVALSTLGSAARLWSRDVDAALARCNDLARVELGGHCLGVEPAQRLRVVASSSPASRLRASNFVQQHPGSVNPQKHTPTLHPDVGWSCTKRLADLWLGIRLHVRAAHLTSGKIPRSGVSTQIRQGLFSALSVRKRVERRRPQAQSFRGERVRAPQMNPRSSPDQPILVMRPAIKQCHCRDLSAARVGILRSRICGGAGHARASQAPRVGCGHPRARRRRAWLGFEPVGRGVSAGG